MVYEAANFILLRKVSLNLKCANCTSCHVMKIEEKLRKVYDWANPDFQLFNECGKRFDDKNENILCFTEALAKTINWNAVKKVYESHKEQIDKDLKG